MTRPHQPWPYVPGFAGRTTGCLFQFVPGQFRRNVNWRSTMSAYIVDTRTIALIAIAAATDWTGIKRKQAYINANTLIRANIKSIATRYPGRKGKEIESFFPDWTERGYRQEVKEIIDVINANPTSVKTKQFLIDVAKAAADFDYQACEFASYPRSNANLIQLNAGAYAGYKLADVVEEVAA